MSYTFDEDEENNSLILEENLKKIETGEEIDLDSVLRILIASRPSGITGSASQLLKLLLTSVNLKITSSSTFNIGAIKLILHHAASSSPQLVDSAKLLQTILKTEKSSPLSIELLISYMRTILGQRNRMSYFVTILGLLCKTLSNEDKGSVLELIFGFLTEFELSEGDSGAFLKYFDEFWWVEICRAGLTIEWLNYGGSCRDRVGFLKAILNAVEKGNLPGSDSNVEEAVQVLSQLEQNEFDTFIAHYLEWALEKFNRNWNTLRFVGGIFAAVWKMSHEFLRNELLLLLELEELPWHVRLLLAPFMLDEEDDIYNYKSGKEDHQFPELDFTIKLRKGERPIKYIQPVDDLFFEFEKRVMERFDPEGYQEFVSEMDKLEAQVELVKRRWPWAATVPSPQVD